jgi:hypothetical protein
MNLPSSLRRFLRKVARYAGPVGASTVLRGCPCPPAEFRPPQPYTSSLAIDADTTLDATPASWEPYCTETCGETSSECYVRVNTSDGNSIRLTTACDDYGYGQTNLPASMTPWMDLCAKTCFSEQDCLIGPDRAQNNKIIINCVSWWKDCAGGRSTEGITVAIAPTSPNPQGQLLARMATLEAESIPAFRRLARELAALGAPRKLRRQAARSRRDEQRHARTIGSLARRHGATPASVIDPERALPLRALEEVALENAIEGCIRETYGAWNAWKQSQDAGDPELRATMHRIAADETRHAALAWDIHQWAIVRLDKRQRNRITQAMNEAWMQIATDCPEFEDLAAAKQALAVC